MEMCCSYCERSCTDIMQSGVVTKPSDALVWVRIHGRPILLCAECRLRFSDPRSYFNQLLSQPIQFPEGVTSIEHTCPQLEFAGYPPDQCTFVLEMKKEDTCFRAMCPHCGVVVQSVCAK